MSVRHEKTNTHILKIYLKGKYVLKVYTTGHETILDMPCDDREKINYGPHFPCFPTYFMKIFAKSLKNTTTIKTIKNIKPTK